MVRRRRPPATDLQAIVAVARWTPSGDNRQPWRFELRGGDTILVQVTLDQSDVYDYEGRATELAADMLLESIRLAAADLGRELTWQSADRSPQGFSLTLRVPKTGIGADTLTRFVKVRSVDRRPFRTERLNLIERAALEAACGSALDVRFAETLSDKLGQTAVKVRSTLLRLRIREASEVHRRVVDFKHRFSADGVPAESLGLDPVTLAVLRWGMKSLKLRSC